MARLNFSTLTVPTKISRGRLIPYPISPIKIIVAYLFEVISGITDTLQL